MTACVIDASVAAKWFLPPKDAFAITATSAMYVALAIVSDVPLVTADERLANALAARYPVRWLGSL